MLIVIYMIDLYIITTETLILSHWFNTYSLKFLQTYRTICLNHTLSLKFLQTYHTICLIHTLQIRIHPCLLLITFQIQLTYHSLCSTYVLINTISTSISTLSVLGTYLFIRFSISASPLWTASKSNKASAVPCNRIEGIEQMREEL